ICPVDPDRSRTGPYPDVLCVPEKLRGPLHMEARAHQFPHVAYISRNEIRYSATAVGNVFVLINYYHIGVRFKPFEAARRLRPKSNPTDYHHAFSTHQLPRSPSSR